MNKLVYFQLEIKRKIKLIPTLLIGTIALSIIIGGIVFCAGKIVSSKNSTINKKQLVFTSDDKSALTKMVVNTLSQSESINQVCDVLEEDYETSMNGIDEPPRIATIMIPSDFLNNLIIGTNLPIDIYYSSTQSLYTLVISELAKASELSLKSAQASVFVLCDYYMDNNRADEIMDAYDELDMIYITRAFTRDGFFRRVEVTATGNVSMVNYYIASAIMLVILLLGCIFILKIKDTSNIFSLKLKQNGIGTFTQVISNILSIFIVLYIFLTMIMLVFYILGFFLTQSFNISIINILFSSVFVALSGSCIITAVSNIISGKYSSILLYFILIFTSGFASGAFIPSLLLPESLKKLSVFLPTTYIQNVIGSMFMGEIYYKDIVILLMFCLAAFTISIIFLEIHYRILKYFGRRGDF